MSSHTARMYTEIHAHPIMPDPTTTFQSELSSSLEHRVRVYRTVPHSDATLCVLSFKGGNTNPLTCYTHCVLEFPTHFFHDTRAMSCERKMITSRTIGSLIRAAAFCGFTTRVSSARRIRESTKHDCT
jgi:hypothetical protein